jgi:hypothetical protein
MSIYRNPVTLRDGSIMDGCVFELLWHGVRRSLVRDSNGDKFTLPNRDLDFEDIQKISVPKLNVPSAGEAIR